MKQITKAVIFTLAYSYIMYIGYGLYNTAKQLDKIETINKQIKRR